MSVKPDLQRLFYRGKQLENGYKLFDYNVNLNEVIQLMVKAKTDEKPKEEIIPAADPIKEEKKKESNEEELIEAESLYYRVGDCIDCIDIAYGAWFEARIIKIFKRAGSLIYGLKWEFEDADEEFDVAEQFIRPRARRLLNFNELEIGQKVMVNHNVEEPKKNGFWYDLLITKIHKNKANEELTGTLYVGRNHLLIENCKVKPKGEVFAIEEPKLLEDCTAKDLELLRQNSTKRRVAVLCTTCMDNTRRKCRDCGCRVCAGKEDAHHLLLCDECNSAYHLRCLDPPLESIPTEDDWYCPECKNDENEIVKAGDKLKQTKKKTKTTLGESKDKRDWGKGMACVGRTKECTLVPPNHRGPIPGVEVGMCWMFRLQVSEAGVHRPHVAGIHGRETDCAYSIVLSGGYEDDIDNGDEFMYTGSGGRDLSGNKRTAEQSCDQTLTRMNKALAQNCNAKLNSVNGATATNWRGGIPVRVVRNYKLAKHSKYAPKEGNRYDGIYKVVKYFPERGKSGFSVWRYLLRRDDPAPAPWTAEGKKRIASLDLEMMYPDGFLEAKEQNKSTQPGNKRSALREKSNSPRGRKASPPKKKQKREGYQLDDKLSQFIEEDQSNAKLWEECAIALPDGKAAYLQRVSERFQCVCCQEIVFRPVTTPCAHNICLSCLKRSFVAEVYTCPACRHALDKDCEVQVNEPLSSALLLLYPGYEAGR
ncbi:E3 ubiquitin-protein ligase UHRF1 isoform X2 [Orussus abietinus]|nr:E3 ubiquitin-protein ligase UHRF1 isoform X2 [Orussus abietinus]